MQALQCVSGHPKGFLKPPAHDGLPLCPSSHSPQTPLPTAPLFLGQEDGSCHCPPSQGLPEGPVCAWGDTWHAGLDLW